MSTEKNKKVVEKLFAEGLSGKNLDVIDELIAPKFVNHGIPDAKPGPAGFKEVVKQFLTGFPDMKINAKQVVAEGDSVATMGYWTGTHKGTFMGIPATNKTVQVSYIDWWTVENGKCTENWVQMDMPAMMAQLGVQPGAATAH